MEELQGAFFVERMKDLFGKMAKAEGKVEAMCEQCAGAKFVAFCLQCAEFICGDCARSHKKMKAFTGHVVASLKDLKRGGPKSIPFKEAPPTECPDHDKQMKIFCFDCNRLICRDCTVIDHNGHNFNFLKKCAPESRKTLRDSLAPLRKVQAEIAGAEKKLNATEAQVDTQKNEVCKSLEQSFNQLKVLLDQRKAELVKKASTLAQKKKDALAAQRKGLQVAQAEIQSLVEFVEQNVENTSDQDLMGIHKQLQTKVEEEEKRHQHLSLEPATTANISCNPPSPDAVPRELGAVFPAGDLAKLNVTLPETCSVGESAQVSVKVPQSVSTNIQAQLKSLADPSCAMLASVAPTNADTYTITFTPRVRGRHDLTVTVNGKTIAGSPFRVFAKIHPTQLGKPLRTILGLENPWGIAINSKQQLVVAESVGRMVIIMERDGKSVQTIECDKFKHPRGVATGPDGAIYVTDVTAQCLFIDKFNKEGKLLKTVQSNLKKPHSVKIIRNQLYVADNSNQVQIFDTDCNAVGSIQTKECPRPYDIAEGEDGLYVVGVGGRMAVYRCAPNGEFIRRLNTNPSLALSNIYSICFDCSGHFIVGNCYGFSGVYAFKPSGEHVASLSVISRNMDGIQQPIGTAVDEDGFVCVCDYMMGTVTVF